MDKWFAIGMMWLGTSLIVIAGMVFMKEFFISPLVVSCIVSILVVA